ncbi:GNAT family N-acetyltransferase [Larsenimonas rhizosphaerae]|uniref:GNAT family N-acetyltransferase n=1 Tax=Larsenimonas rhizosphaerae TaxID=2944682 RepID=UPI002033788D|nr:GNAT family N-acetyltransferase [Larsenimonas rhizosphaerae]MCM2129432.1 GNAT family N-acetyltransferase [Larsenimonas rhizosphaerae]
MSCRVTVMIPASCTTFYLELPAPREDLAPALPPRMVVDEVTPPDWRLNRRLYHLVGDDWQWEDLDEATDEEWQKRIADPTLRTWTATVGDTLVGYFELHRPDHVTTEIRYLGLCPGWTDQKLGGPLLGEALRKAWGWPGTRRVWVHTCTLDHPSALANYQARGMVLYHQVEC